MIMQNQESVLWRMFFYMLSTYLIHVMFFF